MTPGGQRLSKSAIAFVLLVAGAFGGAVMATPASKAPDAQQAIQVFGPDAGGIPSRRLEALRSGLLGKPENFAIKAEVVFKTESRAMIAEARSFVLHTPAADSLPQGWHSEGRAILWRGDRDGRPASLDIPFEVAKGNQPFRLLDHEELWIDYSVVPGVSTCVPQLKMAMAIALPGGERRDVVANTGSWQALKVLSSIDVVNSRWKERDYVYVARRMLGFGRDDDWRYAQAETLAVLQRRMHETLDQVEELEISLFPGVVPKQVNLRVSAGEPRRSSRVIEFPLANRVELPDGRLGVRLKIREELEKNFPKELADYAGTPGKQKFFLEEIVAFVPGEARAVAESGSIRNLSFLAADVAMWEPRGRDADVQIRTLASRAAGVNIARQRLIVDLRPLERNAEFDFRNASIQIIPPEGATSCAIIVEQAQAVSPYNGSVPTYAMLVRDRIESPGFIGRLAFSSLTAADPQRSSASEAVSTMRRDNQAQGLIAARQNRSLSQRIPGTGRKDEMPDRGPLASSTGARMTASGDFPSTAHEGTLLVLEGSSTALDFSWPLIANIGKGTLFYLSIPGGPDQIGSIELSLKLANGTVISRRILPNELQRELTDAAEVRNVKLRIVPSVSPFKLKLLDMTIIEPGAVSFGEAFSTGLPISYLVNPKPVLHSTPSSMLDVKAGRVTGLPSTEPLRFSMTLEPALAWVRGVRLQFRLPAAYLSDRLCQLTLQFTWAKGRTDRQVCLERPEGTLFIPVANLLGPGEGPGDLGALKSIDWTLRSGDGKGATESFAFGFGVDGEAMISAADQLRISPLLFVGGTPIFIDPVEVKEIAAGTYAQKVWIRLDHPALMRAIWEGRQIHAPEHELFRVDQLVMEPRQPMSSEQWDKLTEAPTLGATPRWPKWLMWAIVILIPWVTWAKGWWSPGRIWIYGKDGLDTSYRMARIATGRLKQFLPHMNVAIGVLALGPGLWIAGRLGWSFAGAMVLITAGLLAWGAYHHWRGWPEQGKGGGDFSRRPIIAAGLALGGAIWSFGRYGVSVETMWAFLPVLGAAYALLPTLSRWSVLLFLSYRQHLTFLKWLILTIGLYALGLRVSGVGNENYFFTFGGLAAVFALRAAILVLEPRVRRRFPAAAERVYGSAGGLYFLGALAVLIATAVMLGMKRQLVAEQLAVIVYYCLVIGVVKEALVRRDSRRGRNAMASQSDVESPV